MPNSSTAPVGSRPCEPEPHFSWWGEGKPPHERWPGVTIEIECMWRPLPSDAQLIQKTETEQAWICEGVEIPAWYAEDGGRWESPDGLYYFDREAAADACDFFAECLTHHKGEFANKPFFLDVWQRMLVVVPIFGWKIRETGLRRFRKVYIEIPKKNGKSQLSAGLGLYMTFCDGEDGAEIYCAAADREQAAIVFDEAKAMVEDCPDLIDRANVFRRSIVFRETRSSFKVLSADARTKHGPNIHCLIFDELHAQPNRDLFDTLEKGIAARRQPLIIMITTAGDDQESICYEQHEYAVSVIKDGGDDSFLPVIFGLSKEQDWTNIEVLGTVNPSLGITVKTDYLTNEVRAALKDPRKQNAFKRLHGNIWTQQAKLWIPIEKWDACKTEVNEDALIGLPVAGGMDLSSKIDLSSFVLAFMHRDAPGIAPIEVEIDPPDKLETVPHLAEFIKALEPAPNGKKKFRINFSVTLLPFFWMPEESLTERKAKDRFGYDVMKDEGLLEITEGNIIDYDAIYSMIVEKLAPKYNLRDAEIGYDPWNATQLATQLSKDGFKMIEIPQTIRHLSEPSKIYEALVLSGRIRHSGHRILRWNVENVAVKEDPSGNIRPVKSSNMKRIDGVIASIDAISRLLVRKEESGPTAMWV